MICIKRSGLRLTLKEVVHDEFTSFRRNGHGRSLWLRH